MSEFIARHEQDFMATLTDTQHNSFDNFKACVEERHQLTEVNAFANGFSLGARIMLEIM